MTDRIYPIFRQVDGGPGWRDGIHHLAELHDPDAGALRDSFPYPIALAWLTAYGPETGIGTCLDFILVPDHLRRLGYARRLIAECAARWPDLWLTDAISPEGEALLAALERDEAAAAEPPP